MGDRYIEFRYEDLLLDPEPTISRLERFITGNPDRSVTERFMAASGSLRTNKVETWREVMPSRSQAIFEGVAGDMLKVYGYPLTGLAYVPPLLLKAGYVIHNRLSREGWHLARKVFREVSERK
jgi:hypothetical protein